MKDLKWKKLLFFLSMLSLMAFLSISCQSDDDDNDGSSPSPTFSTPLVDDSTKGQYADQALADSSWDAGDIIPIDTTSDAEDIWDEASGLIASVIDDYADGIIGGMGPSIHSPTDAGDFATILNNTNTLNIDSTGDCEVDGSFSFIGTYSRSIETDEETFVVVAATYSIEFELDNCENSAGTVVYGKGKSKMSNTIRRSRDSETGYVTNVYSLSERADSGFVIDSSVTGQKHKFTLGYGNEVDVSVSDDPSSDESYANSLILSINNIHCASQVSATFPFGDPSADMPDPDWNCTISE